MDSVEETERPIKVHVTIRGFDDALPYYCESVTFEMEASDTIATLKAKIADEKGVPILNQHLRTYEGKINDTVQIGSTFTLNGIHEINLWRCKCYAYHNHLDERFKLMYNGNIDEFKIVVANYGEMKDLEDSGSAPTCLKMTVQPTYTISFLKTYLNMIFGSNTEISYEGRKLLDEARTLQECNIRRGSLICLRTYTSDRCCEIFDRTTLSKICWYLSSSTTIRDLKSSIEYILGIPQSHLHFNLPNSHLIQPYGEYNFWYGVPHRFSSEGCNGEVMKPQKTTLSTDVLFGLEVMTCGGFRVPINATGTSTVAMVKHQIEKDRKITSTRQRLLLDGRILEDCRTLNDYNIREGSVLQLLIRPKSTRLKTFFSRRGIRGFS